jgi:hypothetical protein
MPLLLTEAEIHEKISQCQEAAKRFASSSESVKRTQISNTLRLELSKKIGSKCPTCDTIITKANPSSGNYSPIVSSFTVEHLFPLAVGGDNTYTNLLVAMCHNCNSRRNNVMQQFIGSRKSSPKALEKLRRFVEWSITSVLLPEKEQDSEIQEIWKATESLKFEYKVKKTKKEKPPSLVILMERISALEDRIEELENTRWRRLTRFVYGLFKRKPNYTAEQVLLDCIGSGGTTPVILGQKITEYQKEQGWEETGKGAFNERFQLPRIWTYSKVIEETLGNQVKITGSGNNARYSIATNNSTDSKPEVTLTPEEVTLTPEEVTLTPEEVTLTPEEVTFTPEDFSAGLLRQRTREGQMAFHFLYDRLIKENPKFKLSHYGIKPSSYLQEECSSLLSIEKRMHKNGKTSTLWINDKPEVQRNIVSDLTIDSSKIIENARERAAKDANKQIDAELDRIARTNTHAKEKDTPKPTNGFPPSSIRQGIPGFSSANKSIKFPRDPEHLLILVGNFSRPNPDSLSYRELLTESRTTLGKSMPGGSDLRLWMSLQNMRRQGEDDIIHVSYSNSSPEEIISELHQYIRDYMIPEFPYEVNTESVDAYFHSIGSTFKT